MEGLKKNVSSVITILQCFGFVWYIEHMWIHNKTELIFGIAGSAADVCDLQMKDMILSVNRKDVANMTQPQVQHIIDMAAKQGHVELKIKREMGEGKRLVLLV